MALCHTWAQIEESQPVVPLYNACVDSLYHINFITFNYYTILIRLRRNRKSILPIRDSLKDHASDFISNFGIFPGEHRRLNIEHVLSYMSHEIQFGFGFDINILPCQCQIVRR